jgi:pimeloyl-ACP methyl ester carboxylesterase
MHELATGAPDRPPVLFVHGLEDSWESWLPLARRLDLPERLVAVDLPWRPGGDYRWRRRPPGHWLRDALERLPDHPSAIVAHSFGANALLELLTQVDCDSAVVMICPLYRPPDRAVTPAVIERSRRTFLAHIQNSLRTRLASRLERLEPEVVARMIDRATERIGVAGFDAVFEQYAASGDLPVEKIAAPVLVLAGDSDPTLDPVAAQALVDRLPDGELTVREGYDHFCHLRHPAEIAAAIRRFLRRGRKHDRQ